MTDGSRDPELVTLTFDADHRLKATAAVSEDTDPGLQADFARLVVDLQEMEEETRRSLLLILALKDACERRGQRLLIEIVGPADEPGFERYVTRGMDALRLLYLKDIEPGAVYGAEWRVPASDQAEPRG